MWRRGRKGLPDLCQLSLGQVALPEQAQAPAGGDSWRIQLECCSSCAALPGGLLLIHEACHSLQDRVQNCSLPMHKICPGMHYAHGPLRPGLLSHSLQLPSFGTLGPSPWTHQHNHAMAPKPVSPSLHRVLEEQALRQRCNGVHDKENPKAFRCHQKHASQVEGEVEDLR